MNSGAIKDFRIINDDLREPGRDLNGEDFIIGHAEELEVGSASGWIYA
jgi:hypothetical protein